MPHERASVSATVEALQFLIPCPFCGELVKGDDCPTWRGSLLEFKIWLNRSAILKSLILLRNEAKKIKTTIRRRTEELYVFCFAR